MRSYGGVVHVIKHYSDIKVIIKAIIIVVSLLTTS